jgi:hypothetical protein
LTVVPFPPPVALPDAYTLSQDTILTVPAPGVLLNDTTSAGSLTSVLDTSTSHGTLSFAANGAFMYMPATGFAGFDSFTYHAFDGTANSNIVTVSLTVTAGIAKPVALPDTYTVQQGTGTLTVPAGTGVLANDTTPSGTLTAVLNTTTSHGILSLAANGGFTYLPSPVFIGADGFTYHAFNGSQSSGIAPATIGVTAATAPSTPAGTGPLARPLSFRPYAGRRYPAPSTFLASVATTSLVLAGVAALGISTPLIATTSLVLAGRARFSARGAATSVTPKA